VLDVVALNGKDAWSVEANATIITHKESGKAVCIVRQGQGGLIELLTPNDRDFNKALAILTSAAKIAISAPTEVIVEGD
jgi:hypothetical protein